MMRANDINLALEHVKGKNVLIIGDVMVDAYYRGSVDRISPEAPVPVLSVTDRDYRLGGAANVARNIQGMSANPILCSVIGNDEGGDLILKLLNESDMSDEGILQSASRKTTMKTRLMSGHQQLIRVDDESTDAIDSETENVFLERIESLIEQQSISAIIFEDYDKGVITESLIQGVMKLAKAQNILVTVDPKKRNFFFYAGVDLFKPNLRELKDGLYADRIEITESGLKAIHEKLSEKMPVKSVLFTLASKGVYISDGNESFLQPAFPREIADVSGAGDTVISVATCGMIAGLNLEQIAFTSNLAGGWVCQFPGVVSIELGSLQDEVIKALN